MSSVALLVVAMDVLKYGFGIDPVKKEFEEIQKKKKKKDQRTIIAIRYLYVHSSKTSSDNDPCVIPPSFVQT
jgi:hypothetical protein